MYSAEGIRPQLQLKIINIPYFSEQRLVGRSLLMSARSASESMEKFVHWMLAGFGGGLIYLLGQTASGKSQVLELATLKAVGELFIYALVLGGLQRILAMFVQTMVTAFQEGEKLPDNSPIDLARFYILYIQTMPASNRWLIAWTARRFIRGHITDSARGVLMVTMAQSVLGFATVVILLRGLYLMLAAH